jgi:Tetratricopeptide repeat
VCAEPDDGCSWAIAASNTVRPVDG